MKKKIFIEIGGKRYEATCQDGYRLDVSDMRHLAFISNTENVITFNLKEVYCNRNRFSTYEEALCAYCREVLLPKSEFWQPYVDYALDIEKYLYRGSYEEYDSIGGFIRWLFEKNNHVAKAVKEIEVKK